MIVHDGAPLAAVVGWPVAHSLSPYLHRRWLDMTGAAGDYVAFSLAPDDAPELLGRLGRLGVSGVNVTAPHKGLALKISTQASAAARTIGAANLLLYRDGEIEAQNTDADGFLCGLGSIDFDPAGVAVVLGSGGAARSVVYGLTTAEVGELRLVCRNTDEAKSIAAMVESVRPGLIISIWPWDRLGGALTGAAFAVNTTPLGSRGKADLVAPVERLRGDAVVCDIVYSPLETRLLRDARQAGLATLNGLHMLVGQARPSFEAFFGCPAPDDPDAVDVLSRRLERTA